MRNSQEGTEPEAKPGCQLSGASQESPPPPSLHLCLLPPTSRCVCPSAAVPPGLPPLTAPPGDAVRPAFQLFPPQMHTPSPGAGRVSSPEPPLGPCNTLLWRLHGQQRLLSSWEKAARQPCVPLRSQVSKPGWASSCQRGAPARMGVATPACWDPPSRQTADPAKRPQCRIKALCPPGSAEECEARGFLRNFSPSGNSTWVLTLERLFRKPAGRAVQGLQSRQQGSGVRLGA